MALLGAALPSSASCAHAGRKRADARLEKMDERKGNPRGRTRTRAPARHSELGPLAGRALGEAVRRRVDAERNQDAARILMLEHKDRKPRRAHTRHAEDQPRPSGMPAASMTPEQPFLLGGRLDQIVVALFLLHPRVRDPSRQRNARGDPPRHESQRQSGDQHPRCLSCADRVSHGVLTNKVVISVIPMQLIESKKKPNDLIG